MPSKKGSWYVLAEAPPALAMTGWDFPFGFFPRGHYYKRDAEEQAEEAKRKGGKNVRVERHASRP
jgi:hypothetical protein